MPRDLSRVGGPNPDAADGRLALAALRRAMFERDEPVQLDRYRLLRKIGQGAQGTVFEADDVELGRRIAVKVLAGGGGVGAPDQRRLLREARAMASVNHPHVVQVYAAGQSEGQVWIAMELVVGTTLQQWLADACLEDAATREEARRILRCAGEGLAAAHALGFVHRDFKPANLLLGQDGSVKLTDFGLARPFNWLVAADLQSSDAHRQTNPDQPVDDSFGCVRDTAWAGTPRYMSPEQLRGKPAGVASDQFNFAVTAWEVLLRTHPFPHDSLLSLEMAIAAQAVSRPPAGRASKQLLDALKKALRPEPAQRHASLQPLLDALAPKPRSRGWTAMFAGAGACALVALLWPAAAKTGGRCNLSESRDRFELAGGASREDVEASIVRTSIPDAHRVAARVGRELDAYTQRWVAEQHAVCEAGWGALGEEQRLFDARNACLQQARATVSALTERLAGADAALASQAVSAVRGLPDPDRCLTDGVVGDVPSPQSRALRSRVAVAQADVLAGHYREGAAAAEQVGFEATRASLPGVKAAALEVAGRAYGELSDPRRFRALTDAYYAAVELDDVDSMARLGGELARQNAYADQVSEARWWLRHGQAAWRPEAHEEVQLVFDHAAGMIAFRDDDPESGESLLLGVLDRAQSGDPKSSETRWLASLWLASYYSWRGRPEDGDALCEELREAITSELGPAHPRLARVATTQATAAGQRGDRDGALGYGYEAVELAERGFGPINERTALGHLWLARVLKTNHRFDEADAHFRAAARAAGDAPSKVKARSLLGWAALRTAQDQPRDALALLRRSEKIGELVFEADSAELARLREQLADARNAVTKTR